MFELHNTRYVSEEKSDMGCRSSADYSNLRVLKFSGGAIKKMFCNNCVHRSLIFRYQNCSDLLWEKIVLVIVKKF